VHIGRDFTKISMTTMSKQAMATYNLRMDEEVNLGNHVIDGWIYTTETCSKTKRGAFLETFATDWEKLIQSHLGAFRTFSL